MLRHNFSGVSLLFHVKSEYDILFGEIPDIYNLFAFNNYFIMLHRMGQLLAAVHLIKMKSALLPV